MIILADGSPRKTAATRGGENNNDNNHDNTNNDNHNGNNNNNNNITDDNTKLLTLLNLLSLSMWVLLVRVCVCFSSIINNIVSKIVIIMIDMTIPSSG